jgi:hypothetical protein
MGKIKSSREFSAEPRSTRPRGNRRRALQTTPALGFPTIPLEELARCQGVKPLTDLKGFGSLWPAEFNPDEFLSWLSGERKARRNAAANADMEPD